MRHHLGLSTAHLRRLAKRKRALANRALADDTRYSMALLLLEAIDCGSPPSLARLPMTPEEVAASYADLEDGDPGDDIDRAGDAAGEP